MKSLAKMLALGAVTALCVVAPAAATVDVSPPQTTPSTGAHHYATNNLRAGGTVHLFGKTGPLGTFSVVPVSPSRERITFVNKAAGVDFHSLGLVSIEFGPNAVRMGGTGVFNGKMVQFTAMAVGSTGHGSPARFGITWNGRARMGGPLSLGFVRITQTAL